MSLTPLPLWTWAVLTVLMGMAVWQDLTHRRIPNRLLLCSSGAGLLLAAWPQGIGLGSALAAALLAGAAWAPMYLLGRIGGGDLKLMATAGLLVGMPRITALCLSVAMAGGLLALWWLWRKRQQPQTANQHLSPFERMPYALAVALGTAAHSLLADALARK